MDNVEAASVTLFKSSTFPNNSVSRMQLIYRLPAGPISEFSKSDACFKEIQIIPGSAGDVQSTMD
jgi:hypothetical protein